MAFFVREKPFFVSLRRFLSTAQLDSATVPLVGFYIIILLNFTENRHKYVTVIFRDQKTLVMAAVSAVVYDFHKKERKLIDTPHFVSQKQLDSKFRIKDRFLNKLLDEKLDEYRRVTSELGNKLNFMTAENLRDYLRDRDKDVDFIPFCNEHIEHLRKSGRGGTANNHRTVRNSLVDYFVRNTVSITEIHSNMLMDYERWLRTERTMTRINQLGNEFTTKEKGLKDAGIYCHMRDLRTLFNAVCTKYNNEDLGIYRIKHYSFKKYKVGSPPPTKKRNFTIVIELLG